MPGTTAGTGGIDADRVAADTAGIAVSCLVADGRPARVFLAAGGCVGADGSPADAGVEDAALLAEDARVLAI